MFRQILHCFRAYFGFKLGKQTLIQIVGPFKS